MSVNSIQKQKKELTTKIYTNALLATGYSMAYVYGCHVLDIMHKYPRLTINEAADKAFGSILTNPVTPVCSNLEYLPIYLLGGAALTLMHAANKKPITEHLEENQFMTLRELKEYNKECVEPFNERKRNPDKSLIYTKDLWLSYVNEVTQMNMNAIITAGSGKGKTFYFLSPNLLHLSTNAVITDPSMELVNRHGKDLENRGYEILVFNTKNPYKGLRYNPFVYINHEQDAITLIETFINTTEGKGKDKDKDFWIKCEFFLLAALTLYMYHTMPVEQRTFRTILKLMKDADINENDMAAKSELDRKFEELERRDPNNTAVSYYKDFKVGAGKTLKSILISVNARLAKLELPSMQYLTGKDELNLDSFADSKKVLFVCIPTGDHTFDFIVSMLYSQLFMKMYAYAEDTARFGYSVSLPESGTIKAFRAKSNNLSHKAEKKALLYKEKLTGELKIVPNKKKKYFEIRTKDDQLVSWRGTRKDAEIFCTECKSAKIVKNKNRCPIHVQLFLDEFANISQIPEFCAKLSTIRKYAIGCSIILQGIGQLETIYKDDWEDITSNCDVKLCLGNTDDKTIKWIQSLLGKREITVASESHGANGTKTVNYTPHSVDMLPGYKISQMNRRHCVAIISGHNPIFGLKYQTQKDRRFKECMKTEGTFLVDENKPKEYIERDIPLIEREAKRKEAIKKEKSESKQAYCVNNMKAVQNTARRHSAQQAQKALDEFKDYEPESDEVIMQDLCTAFGIRPDMTREQIKEQVESMVVLMDVPSGDMSYSATG